MQTSAREAYLETQVMTATPQKLHLMLIEGAVRAVAQTQHHWKRQQDELAGEALIRAQDIVGEMLGAVGAGTHEISRRLAGIYLFVFHALGEAHLRRDESQLADALRVLEIERETWRQACEKFGAQVAPGEQPAPPVAAKPAPSKIAPPLDANQDLAGGFSFQA
jgi:flagellar protein FliS